MNTSVAKQTQPTELDQLAFAWHQAKADEDNAKKRRLEIEGQILSRIPSKDEGTVNQDEEFYKLSANYGFTRSIDLDRLTDLIDNQPNEITDFLDDVFPISRKIDLKSLRYLEDKKPDIYKIIAQAITSKPKKPTISVKEI